MLNASTLDHPYPVRSAEGIAARGHDPGLAALLARITTALAAGAGRVSLVTADGVTDLACIGVLDGATRRRRPATREPIGLPDAAVLLAGGAAIAYGCRLDDETRLEIAVARRAGDRPLGDADVRKFRAHTGWIDDYAQLWWSARALASYADRVEAAMGALAHSLVLVAADCRPLFVNPAASALLSGGGPLAIVRGRLATSAVGDDIRLKTVVFRAATDQRIDGHRAVQVLRLARPGQAPLILAVGACGSSGPGDAAVLVQILDPDGDLAPHVDIACAIYGLTGSEARLARLLVCGDSVLSAATKLRVKPDTARTYLKQIFLKTGVNRQTALVQLLLASMVREAPGSKLQLI